MARFAALLLLAAAFAPASAFGANITVTTNADATADDFVCSLREAVTAATMTSPYLGCAAGSLGTDTIVLPANTYVLASTIALNSNLVLSGAGSSTTSVEGNGLARVFTVPTMTVVEIGGLQIANGKAPNGSAGLKGGNGGGIFNEGVLTLTNARLVNNAAGNGGPGFTGAATPGGVGGNGGDGGALYSSGSLTLVNTEVVGNRTGNGGNGGLGIGFPGGNGGFGGNGGGIFSGGASVLTVSGSTIADNSAGFGGTGGGGASVGFAGGGGAGGGIYTASTANLTESTLSGNATSAGTAGQGNSLAGAPGDGGGLFNNQGTLTVSNSKFSGNRTGAGGDSPAGFGQPGGDGGGLASFNGTVYVSNNSFTGNLTGDGGDGAAGAGGGGLGGGIATFVKRLELRNSTVAANTTGSGGSSPSGSGAAGSGGGIAFVDGDLIILHSTIAGNRTGSGASQLGGGLYLSGIGDPAASLTSSIVSSNSPQNCSLAGYGTLPGAAYTVSFPDTTCPGVHADPRLGPLQENGGSSPTMALLAGSAALDLVPVGASCLATDQRGIARPQGPACDAGAFELVPVFPDLTAPLASLITVRQRLGAALRKGYVSRLTTNEAGRGVLELFAKMPGRPIARLVRKRVAFGTRALAAPGQYKIVAKFTRKAKRRFARAQRVVFSVRLTVSDAAGNKTVKTKRVVLRR